MCGASKGLKAAAASAQDLANTVAGEAKVIFGDASDVFNKLSEPLLRIASGGESQMGMSAGEYHAQQAAIAENTATIARNLKGAAGSAAAAIGGGNVVTPAGGTESAVLQAEQAAAEFGAKSQNELTAKNWEIGRENFWNATKEAEGLTQVFNPATSSAEAATSANAESLKAAQAVDTANNWWQPMVTAAIGGASSALGTLATGGASSVAKAATAAKPLATGGANALAAEAEGWS